MILTDAQADAICGEERMPHPTLTDAEFRALCQRLVKLFGQAWRVPACQPHIDAVVQLRRRVSRVYNAYEAVPAEQLRAEVDALAETIQARMAAGV